MTLWSWRKICLAMKRLRQRRISRGVLPLVFPEDAGWGWHWRGL